MKTSSPKLLYFKSKIEKKKYKGFLRIQSMSLQCGVTTLTLSQENNGSVLTDQFFN